MKEINITDLGNPNTLIKQEILKNNKQRFNIIRPILEDTFNTANIHIEVMDADSLPFNLYSVDFILKNKGNVRYGITEEDLDFLLCTHLNIDKGSVSSHHMTQSHHSLFTRLCARAIKYLGEDLDDYQLSEGIRPEYSINLRYELSIGKNTVNVYVSIDQSLAQTLSNNSIANVDFSVNEIKSFISEIPSQLDVILMKREATIKQLRRLKNGDFISLENLDSVEMRVNKHKLMTAKLVVTETSQLGVSYERS